MKLLFVARHFTYFRNFDSVIRLLASRGHTIHLAVERDDTLGATALVEALASEFPGVTYGEAPRREADDWARLAARVRLGSDYLRYLEPEYASTPRLRSRAAERAPAFAVRFGESVLSRSGPVRSALRWTLRSAEAALPGSERIERYLREQAADVMLITPLIGVVGSSQIDYVRAARVLGLPTALCVWSWDHLSSKALIRDVPDRVMVWNEVQKDEARRLHGVPDERIAVTGAQCFDRWFGRQPSRTRAEFCAQAGLAVDPPLILYVGSALFDGSPPEAEFVLRWIARLRASSHPRLRDASVLVRPHPQRMAQWRPVDLTGFPNVALWGGNPVTEAARADYFDALYHSAAVVGLNTSAFLEAGIVGRPVLAILPDEFRDNQEGTLHFHYLTDVEGGLLRVSRTLDEHEAQLGQALAATGQAVNERFLRAFVRPHGLDVEATPVFADAVETLARLPHRAQVPSPSLAGRAALRTIASIAASRRYGEWMMDEEDRHNAEWRRRKAGLRAANRRAGLTREQQAEADREMRAEHKAARSPASQ
jgi:hypothetical protein